VIKVKDQRIHDLESQLNGNVPQNQIPNPPGIPLPPGVPKPPGTPLPPGIP